MEGLYHINAEGQKVYVPHRDGRVKWIDREGFQEKIPKVHYLTPAQKPAHLDLVLSRGHIDFKIDTLPNKILRVPSAVFPFRLEEMLRVFDVGDFGDEHELIVVEGLQRLADDGKTPLPDTYRTHPKYHFEEIPPE